MSNCVCGRTTRFTAGRTTRKPMCDNSCSLSEEQYDERTKRLKELFGPKKQVRVKQEENSDGN